MTHDPEPGGFHTSDIGDDPYATGEAVHDSSGDDVLMSATVEEPDSKLGRATSLLVQLMGRSPEKIIYPGCGSHVIDRLFPNSKVIYVDPAEHSIELIRGRIGDAARTFARNIEDVVSTEKAQHDLLFSLNTHAPMDEQVRCVKPGGFIFCNNYMGTLDAEDVMALNAADLRGVIVYEGQATQETALRLVTDGLDGFSEFDETLPSDHLETHLKKEAAYYIFQKREDVQKK